MFDYLKRILIVAILALFVSIIILGGRAQATDLNIHDKTMEWYFPAEGEISDVFDSRGGVHKGIDIAGKFKSSIFAVDDGEIVRSYYSESYGNVVFIHHSNGFETVYAHLSKRIVKDGQKVKKGDQIGLMGNTGHSTGNHLHFEIHKGEWTIEKENAIDPFLVYGKGEIGQLVFALNHDPYGVVDVTSEMNENTHTNNVSANPVADDIIITTHSFTDISKANLFENSISNNLKSKADKVVKDESVYVVKTGDTLSKISRIYNVSINQLLSWNHIINKDLILPKQKIIIKHI
ncbi:peptidoglycan DD-metalloendopeptidase family protein [Heyndrickxia sp. NPDC080065]|uniref:peptidoglycan DD-metalloendopeptidase family protein n=1 Tax=Heyndrickxia sp. NPDC080065 TaxID=3390568 RepID=UPI003D02756E